MRRQRGRGKEDRHGADHRSLRRHPALTNIKTLTFASYALLQAGIIYGEVDQGTCRGIGYTHAGREHPRTLMYALLAPGITPHHADSRLQRCHDAHKSSARRQQQDQSIIDTIDGATRAIQEPALTW